MKTPRERKTRTFRHCFKVVRPFTVTLHVFVDLDSAFQLSLEDVDLRMKHGSDLVHEK